MATSRMPATTHCQASLGSRFPALFPNSAYPECWSSASQAFDNDMSLLQHCLPTLAPLNLHLLHVAVCFLLVLLLDLSQLVRTGDLSRRSARLGTGDLARLAQDLGVAGREQDWCFGARSVHLGMGNRAGPGLGFTSFRVVSFCFCGFTSFCGSTSLRGCELLPACPFACLSGTRVMQRYTPPHPHTFAWMSMGPSMQLAPGAGRKVCAILSVSAFQSKALGLSMPSVRGSEPWTNRCRITTTKSLTVRP